MTDWGKSGRRNTYTFCLVDPFTLEETGEEIDAEQDKGSITWDYESDSKYSASFNIHNANLSRDRMIRIKMDINVDGRNQQLTLGTFFIDKMPISCKYGDVVCKVHAFSSLWRLTQDITLMDFTRGMGEKVVDAIRYIAEVDGGKLRVLPQTDTTRSFSNSILFSATTNRYEVISDIASWIGCEINCDEEGYITLGRYVEPPLRDVVYTFEEGDNCVYMPGIDMEDLQSDSYNRFRVSYSTQSAFDMAYATLPPSHPFSFERIGRYVSGNEEVQDIMPRQDLETLAQRRLDENSVWDTFYEIKHVFIPGVIPGKVVRYINHDDSSKPIDCKCLVTQVDMELSKTALCTTKLKVIEHDD